MPRLVVAAGLLVMLAAAGVAIAMATVLREDRSSSPPIARLEGTVVCPAGMRPAPNFALRDQNGQLVTRAGLRGHVWAITFLDSRCKQMCPVEAGELAAAHRMLGPRDPLKVVIVSTLPQYDRPATVRSFVRKAGLSGDWHWLLGTQGELEPVWLAYGIQVQTAVSHTAALYLVDQRGDVRVADAVPVVPSQLAASVRALAARHFAASGA